MLEDIRTQLTVILDGMVESTVALAPRVLAGLVLLVVAFVVAWIVERVTRAILARLRFDSLVRRSGIDHWVQRLGIRHSINDVIPRVLYFVLLFLFAREAAEAMGLTAISSAIGTLIGYLPKIIAAFLILLLGSAIAQMAGRAVAETGRASGIEVAGAMGRVTTGVLMVVLTIMALGELEIDTFIVRELSMLLVGGVTAALALSFGLGSRDVTKNILAGMYARRTFSVGESIEVQGQRGTVVAITTTQTLLQQGDHTIVLANAVFLESSARRRGEPV